MTVPPPRVAALLAVGLFATYTAATLFLRPPMPIDETRYVAVAWEMWREESWIVPRLNGELYSHKPPLLFWLINLAWAAGGVTELGARIVAPAFAVVSIGLTWLLGRRLWPEVPSRAGLAALILASSGVFLFFGSTTMFDAPLTAATVWAILSLISLRRKGGWAAILSLGSAMALGVYAKGPVILVHVAPVALLMPLWAEEASRPQIGRWMRDLGLAVLVTLALVAIWLGPALVLGGPEYRTEVLWTQSAGRVADSFAHQQPIWFYLAFLPVFLWPWGWTRGGLAALGPRRIWADMPSRVLVVWSVTAFTAFSLISGKQEHYLLPEMPALALLLSGMALPRRPPAWARLLPLLPAAAVVALVVVVALGLVPEAQANGGTLAWYGLLAALLIMLALLAAAMRLPEAWPGVLLAAPLTLLMFLAAASSLLFAGYDAGPLGRFLAAEGSRGMAYIGAPYQGQLNFAGRLAEPVDTLADVEAVRVWAQAHPGGIVLARENVPDLPLIRVGSRTLHGKDYRLYRVPENPS